MVSFTSDRPKEVDVKFSSTCPKSTIPGRCTDVHVGDVLDFTATIEPRECLPDKKTKIRIYPEALNQSLIVELDVICECSCSSKNSSSYVEKSQECNSLGNLKCGVCECSSGRFGKRCQCDNTLSKTEDIKPCIMEGSTEVCSGESTYLLIDFH